MSKVAFVFPGQGSQYIGMGKSLCSKFSVADRTFEEASDVLGFDLKKLCFEGDINHLTKTENAQPAIFTTSIAAFRAYMEESGITPCITAGHSLGEISALTSSGAIDFADAIRIVKARGRFMQEASEHKSGSMYAVSGLGKDVINGECLRYTSESSFVGIANYNSVNQVIISGHDDALARLGARLTEMGARIIPLKVSAPFHTPLLLSASQKLREELTKYTFHEFKWPVISNLNAVPYKGPHEIVETLSAQMIKPVLWETAVEYMKNQEVSIVVELGPQAILKKLIKTNAEHIQAFSYDIEDDYLALKKLLKTTVDNTSDLPKASNSFKHTVITKCLAIAVCTRNQNWNNEEYQKGVIEPYRKIQQMQESIEKEGIAPTKEQMSEALLMLKSVLATKQVPYEEQVERFHEVFSESGTQELFHDFRKLIN